MFSMDWPHGWVMLLNGEYRDTVLGFREFKDEDFRWCITTDGAIKAMVIPTDNNSDYYTIDRNTGISVIDSDYRCVNKALPIMEEGG